MFTKPPQNTEEFYDKQLRQKQLGIRVSEITALVEELKELSPEFHMDIFGPFCPNIKVNMEELVLSGHSFGGITAVTTASTLPELLRPKAVVAYDPWFFPN